jgi:hypothetical protein
LDVGKKGARNVDGDEKRCPGTRDEKVIAGKVLIMYHV